MMSAEKLRTFLETRQIAVYFVTMLVAFLAGRLYPGTRAVSVAIEPLLAFMLFVTFLQVPVGKLRQAMGNLRFAGALATANFIVTPLLVAVLLSGVPDDPLIRIGFLLVMMAPCIDYVVTFAHLGRADAKALLAATPLLLVGQMLFLPLYAGVFLGESARELIRWEPFVHAFVWLVAMPLGLAAACQAWSSRSQAGAQAKRWLDLLPVPAMAVVLGVVVAAVTPELGSSLDAVWRVAPMYVAYAAVAPLLGWAVARAWRLPPAQRVATAFSVATRNSLVVLPLALAIPGAIPLVPAVIVTQTLVELAAELAYVKIALRWRLAEGGAASKAAA